MSNKVRLYFLNVVMFLGRLILIPYSSIFKNNIENMKTFMAETFYGKKMLIRVNPQKVHFYLPVSATNNEKKNIFNRSLFSEIDFKKNCYLIEQHRKTKDMYELFKFYEAGRPFVDTNAYKQHVFDAKDNNIGRENEPKKEFLNSITKINNYYKNNLKLYKEVKTNGLKTQSLLGNHWTNEIGIAIGEDGEIYRFGNGYHRMAVSKYIGLTDIVVAVKQVHIEWLRYCREKHPDIDPMLAIKKELIVQGTVKL